MDKATRRETMRRPRRERQGLGHADWATRRERRKETRRETRRDTRRETRRDTRRDTRHTTQIK